MFIPITYLLILSILEMYGKYSCCSQIMKRKKKRFRKCFSFEQHNMSKLFCYLRFIQNFSIFIYLSPDSKHCLNQFLGTVVLINIHSYFFLPITKVIDLEIKMYRFHFRRNLKHNWHILVLISLRNNSSWIIYKLVSQA